LRPGAKSPYFGDNRSEGSIMAIRGIQAVEGIQERIIAGLMIVIGLMLIYLLAFDQGQLFSLAMGHAAYQQNMLHEFFHDGRHLFAFACH
jgi:hypothetical protein